MRLLLLIATLMTGLSAESLAGSPRTARSYSGKRGLAAIGKGHKVRVAQAETHMPAAIQYKAVAVPRRRLGWFDVTVATGLNAGWGSAEPSQSGATRNSFVASIMFERRLNDTFSICPELSYAQFKKFHQTFYHPSNTRAFF
ncbi:hypothetical protein K2X33_07150, partial [bacterium]|nr:hypothetical protein [bacterium]